MRNDIISDLRPQIGAAMSLFASGTGLILEAHHPSISIAVQTHSEFYSRPLTRLLKTFLFAEMMFNGTSEEREQTASWLAWTHRNIHGRITSKAREELRLPEDFKSYGYTDDLKAWVMHLLPSKCATANRTDEDFQTFQTREILENTCVALRLGVPDHLLESFMAMFNRQLDLLDHGHSASQKLVEEIENAATTSNIYYLGLDSPLEYHTAGPSVATLPFLNTLQHLPVAIVLDTTHPSLLRMPTPQRLCVQNTVAMSGIAPLLTASSTPYLALQLLFPGQSACALLMD
ncbi:hypothetical protein JR316_0005573 [Psilocybe cubensis]|uniref:ER-bound oxygenase mpaB/mpaB'/Rubber oxygenase catalytic domain-containing protein n=2 Tax=Psilocybe cubensis TaxID=181762 RepID=A0A8H8CLT8_PSICU|nr:hypothetical protein JR316_0005573 [Psilocybe cubensis]KAH9481054.1 hypothetical protein JR316_0005573 [Psilocybe cubensis]